MKRKTAGRKAPPRECHYCGRLLEVDRPVFLVAQVSGRILGPFHAECAAVVVERQRDLVGDAKLPGMDFGRVVPNARQEELL
jgi:hypothetical protein